MTTSILALAVDFDGVIVDSMTLQEISWKQALNQIIPKPDEIIEKKLIENFWAGRSGVRIFEGVGLSNKQQELARKEKDRIWESRRSSVPLMGDVINVLNRISQKIPLFIATSAPKDYVEDVLEREAFKSRFRHIVTDKDVNKPKPAPDMLETIAGYISSTPSHLLLIGDTITDFEMAKAAQSQFLLLDIHSKFSRYDLKINTAKSWKQVENFVFTQ
ncbi:MAG: HAD-IA family hydrolase [Gallionella sp.]|nr:HAD-IA family hydrolase [Gallionella sp.]MDD4959535.1 HAD-IA family hydrolase [Gallionella sp.]